jgi:endonuclease YncB( thermonuclease family)
MGSGSQEPRRNGSTAYEPVLSSGGQAVAQVRLAAEAARDATARATEAVRRAQDQIVATAANTPVLSARFSPDYLRGATELFVAVTALGATVFILRRGLVRYRVEGDIPKRLLNGRSTLHGYVMRVTDGDGLRFYHQPWMRRAMFREMRVMRKISDQTINVRLSGVDAPEMSHFGQPAQKYGNEAKAWLKALAEQRRASLRIHSIDQYKRVLGSVHIKSSNVVLRMLGLGRRNLSLELAKSGYAVVYTGANAEYGGQLAALKAAESAAKRKRIGLWADKNPMSPGEFKAQLRKGIAAKPVDGVGQSLGLVMPAQLFCSARYVFDIVRSTLSRTPVFHVHVQTKQRTGGSRRR